MAAIVPPEEDDRVAFGAFGRGRFGSSRRSSRRTRRAGSWRASASRSTRRNKPAPAIRPPFTAPSPTPR